MASLGIAVACDAATPPDAASTNGGAPASGGSSTTGGTGSGAGGSLAGGAAGESCTPSPGVATVTVDTTERKTHDGTWSLGYWTWAPSYDAPTRGSEELIAALAPPLIRVGCYNNDANVPDPFDQDELDRVAQYAQATGSQLILQVPLLANPSGERASAEEAAAMVEYANVTMGYGIPYVSIGNEPDLYPDMGGLSDPAAPALPGYTPEQYCEEASAFVSAIEEVDASVQFVGPDLGYKYQDFADWLTPILEGCGELFDIVAVHRYPFESLAVTPDVVAGDMDAFQAGITGVRARMAAAGFADKPLAITEANLAYVASPTGNPGGSILGTIAHALWIADFVNTAAGLGLWTATVFDIADPDEFKLGLIGLPPERPLRPGYHALALSANPPGSTLVATAHTVPNLHTYATRNPTDSETHVVLVHWGTSPAPIALAVQGPGASGPEPHLTVPPMSVSSVRMPDGRAPIARTYGQRQLDGEGPVELEVSCIAE